MERPIRKRSQGRATRRGHVRGRIIPTTRRFEKSYRKPKGLIRPTNRIQCRKGIRPCPWVSCRYHLAYEVTASGSLRECFPCTELPDMQETCALDVADRHGVTLEEIGKIFNLSRERIRQIEFHALRKIFIHLCKGDEPEK